MHDSFMPLGGMGAMWLMQLGEVVYGGVGSGLYGMLAFVIVAVFVAGLMVGRTPEYLGKKIETYEMKMASLVVLIPPIMVLLGTALAVSLARARGARAEPRSPRLQRDPVRLLLRSQQQRQRLRRPGHQHPVLQHGPGDRHAGGTLLAGHPDAGHSRLAGGQEEGAAKRRDPADPQRRCSSAGWSCVVVMVGR